jgi:hypothetical protein
MTDLKQAARQALDALENEWFWPTSRFAIDAIDTLRAALSQQQAEPVAWLSVDPIGERYLTFAKPLDNDPAYPLYLTQQTEPVAVQAEPVVDIRALAAKAGLPLAWISETGVIQWSQLERLVALAKQQADPVWELGVAGRLSAEATALASRERRTKPEPDHTTKNCSNDTADDRSA